MTFLLQFYDGHDCGRGDVISGAAPEPQQLSLSAAMLPYLLRTISLTSVVFMIAPRVMRRALISTLRKMCLTSFSRSINSIIVET
jgi:hypothetical protein